MKVCPTFQIHAGLADGNKCIPRARDLRYTIYFSTFFTSHLQGTYYPSQVTDDEIKAERTSILASVLQSTLKLGLSAELSNFRTRTPSGLNHVVSHDNSWPCTEHSPSANYSAFARVLNNAPAVSQVTLLHNEEPEAGRTVGSLQTHERPGSETLLDPEVHLSPPPPPGRCCSDAGLTPTPSPISRHPICLLNAS